MQMLIFQKEQLQMMKKLQKFLRKEILDLNKAKSSIIFDEDCLMGEKITLHQKINVLL
jgi:aminomethyltransferase